MSDKTITSANSSFVLSCPEVGIIGAVIEGYAADAAFAIGSAATAETVMGVDGVLSAGWIPRAYEQDVTLQADSPSCKVFNAIVAAQDAARDIFRVQAIIGMPSIGMSYTMIRGVITAHKPMPDAKKILQPTEFKIVWEKVLPVSVS